MSNHDEPVLKCSFCGKTQDSVKKLIAGPYELDKWLIGS